MTAQTQRKITLSPLQSFAYNAAIQNSRFVRASVAEMQDQINKLADQIEQAQQAATDELQSVMANIMQEHGMNDYPFAPCRVFPNRGKDGKVVELVFEQATEDSENSEIKVKEPDSDDQLQ